MDTQTRELKTGGKAGAPERKEKWSRWKESILSNRIFLSAAVATVLISMGSAVYVGNRFNPAKCAQTTQEMRALAEKSDNLSHNFSGTLEALQKGYISDANATDEFLQIISEKQNVDANLRDKIMQWRMQCSGREKPTQ